MTAYILKLIAIITMVIDHFGDILYHGQLSWMNYIGRIAFPIFAFQISEGYIHTHNLKKYFLRLLLFAIISQIPYSWFHYIVFSSINLNVIFTLILGLLAIHFYQFLINKSNSFSTNKNIAASYQLLGIIVVLLLGLFAEFSHFDYGFWGVFLIFVFYILRDKKILRNIAVIIITFIYYIPTLMFSHFNILVVELFLFTILPLVFINMYNGQKGKNSKLLFYIFYPVHLIILCLISLFIY